MAVAVAVVAWRGAGSAATALTTFVPLQLAWSLPSTAVWGRGLWCCPSCLSSGELSLAGSPRWRVVAPS